MEIRDIVSELVHEKWSRNAEDLIDFIADICENNFPLRLTIHTDYERECHEEDVRIELDERGIDYNDNDIKAITTIYEDRLSDLDDWYLVLNECIHEYLTEVDDDEI